VIVAALSCSFQNSVMQFPHCCGYCDVTESQKYFLNFFYRHRALKFATACSPWMNRDENATA
jgi:hypothetical protein